MRLFRKEVVEAFSEKVMFVFYFNIYLFGCIGSSLWCLDFSLIMAWGLSHPAEGGILGLWPGIKLSALEGVFLNCWTTKEVPRR